MSPSESELNKIEEKKNHLPNGLFVPTCLYVICTACCWLYAAKAAGLATGKIFSGTLFGILLWTGVEYLVHRFILHADTLGQKIKEWHRHNHHHQDPANPEDLFYPLLYSLPIFAIYFGLLFAVTWSVAVTLLIFPGLLLGYLAYEWVHLATHYPQCFPDFMRKLTNHHLRHHAENEGKYFGVTTPIWDLLFRTL